MARIIYGSVITDIKGSIGGITFQKNGSGQIARLKPRKVKTTTQKQKAQHPRLKEVQKEWNELSLVNKISWNDFAGINNKIGLDGNPKTLTGYQWFLSINQNRLLFDDSILSAPPVYEIVNPIGNINLSFEGGYLNINFNTSVNGALYYIGEYSSFVVNSISKFDFNKNSLVGKIVQSFEFNAINLEKPTIGNWSKYFNSNFPPSLGNKSFYLTVFVRFIKRSSGISSLAYTTIAKFVWDGSKYVIE